MATQNSDLPESSAKQAWVKPELVDLDKGIDSVQSSTGALSDGFVGTTS